METIDVKIEDPFEIEKVFVKEEPYDDQTDISNVNKALMDEIKKEEEYDESPMILNASENHFNHLDFRDEMKDEIKVEEGEILTEYPDSNFTVKDELLVSDDDESTNDNTKSLKNERYRCDFCDASYKAKNKLKLHVELHVYGAFQCDYCQKGFTRKDHMKYHILSHFGLYKRKVPDKSTKSVIKIQKVPIIDHKAAEQIRKEMRTEIQGQVCQICGRTYDRRNHLTVHMKLVHSVKLQTPTDFRCKYCDKVYETLQGISDHEKIHTEGEAICKICNKSYSTRSNLYQHMRVHSTQRFKCPTCHQEFSYKQTLKKHVLAKHTKQKPGALQCRVCKKSFSNETNLKRHIENVHLGLRQCICKICDKTFSRKDHLKHHLMNVHQISAEDARNQAKSKVVKKEVCVGCDAKFESAEDLEVHCKNEHGLISHRKL